MIKLDYSLQSPEKRNELVKQILAETPNPSQTYLEVLADYLILCMEKQEKKQRKILTDNRLATVNKRECSYEGLVSQFENGEDGVYNLIAASDKNVIFQPKISITKKDLQEVPHLAQLREAISKWSAYLKKISGREAFVVKKALIEMRRDQYAIKIAYRRPVIPNQLTHSKSSIKLEEKVFMTDGIPTAKGFSLIRPEVCSAILCNYSDLKEETWDQFDGDTWYLLADFDRIAAKALRPYPLYERLVELKIDGLQNKEIQQVILQEFGTSYSPEHLSTLWRRKIPKLISSVAQDEYLDYYYLEISKAHYKKCTRCGCIKLAHPKYFSHNTSSKDGFYSICKACRNQKKGT